MRRKTGTAMMRRMAEWSISYLALCLVAMAVLSLSAIRFSRELRSNLAATNRLRLETIGSRMDDCFADNEKFAVTMNLDAIATQVRKEHSLSSTSRYSLYRLVKETATDDLAGNPFEKRLLYFPRSRFFVSGQTYGPAQAFYDADMEGYGCSMTELEGRLRDCGPAKEGLFSPAEGCLVVWRLLSGSQRRQGPMVACLLIKVPALFGSRNFGMPYDRFFLVHPASATVIGNADEALSPDIIRAAADGQARVAMGRILVSPVPSVLDGWWYVATSPENGYLSPLRQLRWFLLVLAGIYLAVSLGIILIALLRKYRSFHTIFTTLGEPALPAKGDPYAYLDHSIRQLVDERNEQSHHIAEQRAAIRRFVFHRLLTEKSFARVCDAVMLERLDLPVETKPFVVLVLDGRPENDDSLLSRHGLDGVFSRERDLVVCMAWDSDTTRPDLAERALACLDDDPHARIAASDLHTGKEAVATAYGEACMVLAGGQEGSWGGMNLLPEDTLLRFPMDSRRRLENSIKAGDADAAKREVHAIIEANANGVLSEETRRFLAATISSTVFHTLKDLPLPADNVAAYQAMLVEVPKETNGGYLDALLDRLCREVASQSERTASSAVSPDQVKAYIADHFGQVDLNVNQIADHFGIRAAELSRLFNETSARKLYQYIHLVRLEHAKALLKEGGTLESIAQACGFGSTRTFLRIFKQYEGVTPTQYREFIAKQGGGA